MIHAAVLANGGKPLLSIALACHGPQADKDGEVRFSCH